MQTLDTYLSRITSQHRGKPKFEASVSASLTPLLDLLNGLELLPSQFDLDNAVGPQLDATGAWIGRSRWIPQPLPDVWFSFDTSNKGWNDGFIKGPFNVATMLDRLDDDTYRRLLRAKIMSNNWDGTISNAQAMLDEFFTTAANPGTFILVDEEAQANPVLAAADMRVTVALAGKIPPIVDLEIFAQNLIPLAMGGVDQEVRVVSVDNSPMFGFDLNNQYIGGFGSGAFSVDPAYLVANPPANTPPPPSLSAEVRQFFDRLITIPSPTRQGLYRDLIDGLVTDGVWPHLEVLCIPAAEELGAAATNLVSGSYNASGVGTLVVLEVDRGWQGTSSTVSYVRTGFDPSTASLFRQNSAFLAGWNLGSVQANRNLFPNITFGSANMELWPLYSGGLTLSMVNNAGGPDENVLTNPGDTSGWFVADRSGPNAGVTNRNDVQLGTWTTASAPPISGEIVVSTGLSSWRFAAYAFGEHMTAAQHTALYTRLHTYLNAVGAI